MDRGAERNEATVGGREAICLASYSYLVLLPVLTPHPLWPALGSLTMPVPVLARVYPSLNPFNVDLLQTVFFHCRQAEQK